MGFMFFEVGFWVFEGTYGLIGMGYHAYQIITLSVGFAFLFVGCISSLGFSFFGVIKGERERVPASIGVGLFLCVLTLFVFILWSGWLTVGWLPLPI